MITTTAAESIMASLKAATAELHSHAESRPLQRGMAQGRVDRETYVRYLSQLGVMLEKLESELAALGGSDDDLAASARTVFHDHHAHGAAIAADLAALGAASPVPPLPGTLAFVNTIDRWSRETPAALLGCLYVLEGSMNGNRFLARSLARAFGIAITPGAAPPGLTYLDPYGERQRDVWQAFRTSMDAATFSPMQRQQMIDAAIETFRAIADISDQAMAAPASG